MSRMVVTEPKSVLNSWFYVQTGIKHRPEECAYIGEIDLDHHIKGVIIFHSFEETNVELDVAGHAISRRLLAAAKRYVVNQLKCGRVTFKFRADNEVSRKHAVRLGAQLEGRLRSFYIDGTDQLIYGLLVKEYRL